MSPLVVSAPATTSAADSAFADAPPTAATAALRQRGRLTLLPAISQNSRRTARADAASLVGTARFRPARPGRPVRIERRLPGGAWRKVVRKTQDSRGRVRFSGRAARGNKPYAYRVVAPRWRGWPSARTTPVDTADWRLLFDDEFTQGFDTSKWDYRQVGERYGSRLHAASSPRAVDVRGGRMTLSVMRDRQKPCVTRRGKRVCFFLNGHVGSEGKFAFRYGVAAARVKFPRGAGQHGSFWMQPWMPKATHGPAARAGAEIDVVEFFGAGRPKGGLAHFVHWEPKAEGKYVSVGGEMPRASKALRGKRDAWWKRYHVFSVEWTPRQYIFRIDGHETFRTRRGVSKQQQYLILSLLTSDWELPALDLRSLPTRMHVDWVRVWKR